jgi:Putative sensor
MTRSAPRSLDQYLQQLREELAGEDAALIQDALYDAEEYLRAEIAAHPEKSESDVLELIASTYGAPDEVAGAYRDTEAKVKAALKTPVRVSAKKKGGGFFGVFLDPHAYASLFFMILSLATGIIYFVITVAGLSISVGLGVVIIGVPFFLTFIGLTRIISLSEGRLIEAMTGERMPRRPVHPGPPQGFWARIGNMLKDPRTWSTLAYLLLMLPLGIVYFVTAITGLSLSLGLIVGPLVELFGRFEVSPEWLGAYWAMPVVLCAGILLLTALMHLARGVGRVHAAFAKALLVAPAAKSAA